MFNQKELQRHHITMIWVSKLEEDKASFPQENKLNYFLKFKKKLE